MKKSINLFKAGLIVLLLSVLGTVSYGQTVKGPALINPNGLALDTGSQVAAEGPKTAVVKGIAKTFTIVLKTTKISGTIAGTIAWQGSDNGVDFATIGSATALVDATANYQYKEVDKGFLYYKALITQTGTSSLSYSGTYYTTVPPLTGSQ